MMPMLRISESAVVRGIADFHDSFRVTQTGPYGPLPPSSKRAAAVNSFVLLLVGRVPRNPALAVLPAALGPGPGWEGRMRVATYNSNTLLISRVLAPRTGRAVTLGPHRNLYWVRTGGHQEERQGGINEKSCSAGPGRWGSAGMALLGAAGA